MENMENSPEIPRGGGETDSLEKSQVDSLIAFAKQHDIGSDELFAAYQIAMGIPPNEIEGQTAIREKVYSLAQKMGEHMQSGMAVNRIVELISSKRDYELIPDTYYTLVDHVLQVTENEKRVLRSILERKRAGTLTVIDPKSRTELEIIKIPQQAASKDYAPNIFAAELIQILSKFKDQRIEIVFEPL